MVKVRTSTSGPTPKPSQVKREVIKQSVESNLQTKWWFEQDSRLAQSVFSVVNQIETYQSFRRIQNIIYARMYSSSLAGELYGVGASYQYPSLNQTALPTKLKLNVVKSCIDTASAKISKNKPRPLFLTSGGDWHQQKRARQLTKFLDGVFYQAKMYQVAQQVFRDACIFGLGAIKIYQEDEKIKAERLVPEELIVDDVEGAFGTPQQIHQKRYVPRDKVMAAFGDTPEAKQAIHDAPSAWVGEVSARSSADHIVMIESWHLRSGPKADDGKHTITIANCTLLQEDYEEETFPIIVFRWCPQLFGYFGQGLAAELQGIQVEINRLLDNINRGLYLNSNPRVFVEASSKVSPAQIHNGIGAIIKYQGTKPTCETWQACSPEAYQHLENLFNKAFQITGISQLSAQSQKPAGINSGVALREFQDIETERFVLVGQAWENFFVDIAHRCIQVANALSSDVPNLFVRFPNGRQMEAIDYRQVKLDEDDYVLECFPVSNLPQTPAGRLQAIQELMQAGMISAQQGKQLLDYPDLEQFQTLDQAGLDNIHYIIDQIVEKGRYIPPEPHDSLQLGVQLVQAAYQRARLCDIAPQRLEMLRQWMNDAQKLLTPPAQPQSMPPGQAQAVPQAPPQSELMPNTPQTPQAA